MGLTAHRTDVGASAAILTRNEAEVTLVSAGRELDCCSGPELVSNVVETLAARTRGQIIVDLSTVQFIDAAGLRALFECREVAERVGRRLCFASPSCAVHRLARMFGDVAQLLRQEA